MNACKHPKEKWFYIEYTVWCEVCGAIQNRAPWLKTGEWRLPETAKQTCVDCGAVLRTDRCAECCALYRKEVKK